MISGILRVSPGSLDSEPIPLYVITSAFSSAINDESAHHTIWNSQRRVPEQNYNVMPIQDRATGAGVFRSYRVWLWLE